MICQHRNWGARASCDRGLCGAAVGRVEVEANNLGMVCTWIFRPHRRELQMVVARIVSLR